MPMINLRDYPYHKNTRSLSRSSFLFLFLSSQTHTSRSEGRLFGQMTHHWLWGAPSCRCGRCRTAAPASGPCTHTSPGPRSALGQSAGRPSHAERLYLQTAGREKSRINHFSTLNVSLEIPPYTHPRALLVTKKIHHSSWGLSALF